MFLGSNIHFIHRRVKLLIDRGYRVVVHPAPYFLSYTNEFSPEDVSTYRDKTYEVIVTRWYVLPRKRPRRFFKTPWCFFKTPRRFLKTPRRIWVLPSRKKFWCRMCMKVTVFHTSGSVVFLIVKWVMLVVYVELENLWGMEWNLLVISMKNYMNALHIKNNWYICKKRIGNFYYRRYM